MWTQYTTANSEIPSNQVNDLAIDKNGVIWLTTNKGIAAFDGKNWVVYNKKNSGLVEEDVLNISIDNKNNKWFGTYFYGIICFSGHTVKGRLTDEQGNALENKEVQVGNTVVTTDGNGYYRADVAAATNVVVTPKVDGFTFNPPTVSIPNISGSKMDVNFVAQRETLSSGGAGGSEGRVTITPYLEEGYIILSFNAAVAEVEIRSNTKVMRTIPAYKKGNKINISKFPKGVYKITVRTSEWEKTVTLNKKH